MYLFKPACDDGVKRLGSGKPLRPEAFAILRAQLAAVMPDDLCHDIKMPEPQRNQRVFPQTAGIGQRHNRAVASFCKCMRRQLQDRLQRLSQTDIVTSPARHDLLVQLFRQFKVARQFLDLCRADMFARPKMKAFRAGAA
ncbi:hypothetical protein [Falsigemmobacter faecalis]|uniref:Uncharacterized protein n=1 Tax=Falsigemmobacter faecalis TaxID=2488730 RepID=A0A3P3DEG0_9RHOB|nr:hypothetical protein [Falsigemmobacter faecalis]RRH72224.1 hypothetical protein EG244_15510 [Falsigemmobacter faecalis]